MVFITRITHLGRGALFAVALLAHSAAAVASSCGQHYVEGLAPRPLTERVGQKLRELCFSHYAVLHSGLSRTPLAAAEHLTAEAVRSARGLTRQGQFVAERALPAAERAELADYARSGYDRGHLVPSGNAPTLEAQQATFTLANIVPQDPTHNRNLWERVESGVRDFALRRGHLYVITGPLFEGQQLRALAGRVVVPTHLYKLVYDPSTGAAAAYVAANEPTEHYETISLDALSHRAGFDLLPGLVGAARTRMLALPPPAAPYGQRHGGVSAPADRPLKDWTADQLLRQAAHAAERVVRRTIRDAATHP